MPIDFKMYLIELYFYGAILSHRAFSLIKGYLPPTEWEYPEEMEDKKYGRCS